MQNSNSWPVCGIWCYWSLLKLCSVFWVISLSRFFPLPNCSVLDSPVGSPPPPKPQHPVVFTPQPLLTPHICPGMTHLLFSSATSYVLLVPESATPTLNSSDLCSRDLKLSKFKTQLPQPAYSFCVLSQWMKPTSPSLKLGRCSGFLTLPQPLHFTEHHDLWKLFSNCLESALTSLENHRHHFRGSGPHHFWGLLQALITGVSPLPGLPPTRSQCCCLSKRQIRSRLSAAENLQQSHCFSRIKSELPSTVQKLLCDLGSPFGCVSKSSLMILVPHSLPPPTASLLKEMSCDRKEVRGGMGTEKRW